MSETRGGGAEGEPGTPSESDERPSREQHAAARPPAHDLPVFEEEPTRVYCKFPGCGKSYASNDGVRKHAKRYHVQWLMQMDAKKEPVSDTVPPEGYVGDDKPIPPKRARTERLAGAGAGGAGLLELPYGPAATLAGMATGGVGRPPLAPGAHGAAMALAGVRGAGAAGGPQLGGCGYGGGYGEYAQALYAGCGRRQPAEAPDPYPANPRNPVLPLSGRAAGDGSGGAELGGPEELLGAGADGTDGRRGGGPGGGGGAEEGLGFWTHSMPPIKRGPSLLNQIEDEFDGRLADSGAGGGAGAPPPLPLLSQQAQQLQQGSAQGWAAPRANGGGAGAHGAELAGLGSLSAVAAAAAAAAAAAPGAACREAQQQSPQAQLAQAQAQMQQHAGMVLQHSQQQQAQQAQQQQQAYAYAPAQQQQQQHGYAPASGAASAPAPGCARVPPIAPNPSEARLFLDVLDHAEPSAAGPALRRDNSMVAHAAHAGRVPAGSQLDESVDEFK